MGPSAILKKLAHQMPSDNNVYTKPIGADTALLEVNVNDFCVACTTHSMFRNVLADFRGKYHAKDLGIVKRLLGWYIHRHAITDALHLSQPYLTHRFIDVMGMRESRPAKTAYITGLDVRLAQTDEHVLDKTKYPV